MLRDFLLVVSFCVLCAIGCAVGTVAGTSLDREIFPKPVPKRCDCHCGPLLPINIPRVGESADAAAAGLPAHRRLLYEIARNHAAEQLAGEKGITKAAAREKIDKVTDDSLHKAVQASPVQIADLPAGSKLGDFLAWLSAHQSQILEIVKIIMTLLALL